MEKLKPVLFLYIEVISIIYMTYLRTKLSHDNPSIPKVFIHDAHAFVNGALHWVHKYKMTDYHDSIISLDMSE